MCPCVSILLTDSVHAQKLKEMTKFYNGTELYSCTYNFNSYSIFSAPEKNEICVWIAAHIQPNHAVFAVGF